LDNVIISQPSGFDSPPCSQSEAVCDGRKAASANVGSKMPCHDCHLQRRRPRCDDLHTAMSLHSRGASCTASPSYEVCLELWALAGMCCSYWRATQRAGVSAPLDQRHHSIGCATKRGQISIRLNLQEGLFHIAPGLGISVERHGAVTRWQGRMGAWQLAAVPMASTHRSDDDGRRAPFVTASRRLCDGELLLLLAHGRASYRL